MTFEDPVTARDRAEHAIAHGRAPRCDDDPECLVDSRGRILSTEDLSYKKPDGCRECKRAPELDSFSTDEESTGYA